MSDQANPQAKTDNLAEQGGNPPVPAVPDDEHPNIPAGAVPPGGPADSPQDKIRDESIGGDVEVNVNQGEQTPPQQ